MWLSTQTLKTTKMMLIRLYSDAPPSGGGSVVIGKISSVKCVWVSPVGRSTVSGLSRRVSPDFEGSIKYSMLFLSVDACF